MSKKNLTYLLGIVVLLAVATVFVMQKPGEQSREQSAGEPLVKYDSAAVDKLEITSKDGQITLVREGGRWMLTSPLRYPADEVAVTTAVGKGRDMKITALVSTNPAKQSIYSVDSTATLVKVFANNNLVAEFRVGKPATSWTETYVRRDGTNEVYTVEGALTSTFAKSANDWRDRYIFKANQSDLAEVKFQFGDTTFALTKKDSVNWAIGKDSTVNTIVTSFLSSLCSFQTDEFVDSAVTKLPKLTAVIEALGTQIR
ncbi:MAG TPA: DUF4340 domain-containing protein, partial [Bacteroidota bacterium]|nr:DUF4340 domain-containing protein [Bacteroidota bacterium]